MQNVWLCFFAFILTSLKVGHKYDVHPFLTNADTLLVFQAYNNVFPPFKLNYCYAEQVRRK